MKIMPVILLLFGLSRFSGIEIVLMLKYSTLTFSEGDCGLFAGP